MKKIFCVMLEVYIEAPTPEAAEAIATKGAEIFDTVTGEDADEIQIVSIMETDSQRL